MRLRGSANPVLCADQRFEAIQAIADVTDGSTGIDLSGVQPMPVRFIARDEKRFAGFDCVLETLLFHRGDFLRFQSFHQQIAHRFRG